MTKLLTTCFLGMISFCCLAQNHFRLQSHGSCPVRVNGKEYAIDSLGTSIPTNFPSLDTIAFLGEFANYNEPFLCNFKPDSSYSIIGACCGSLHLVKSSKLNLDSLSIWDPEEDAYKFTNQLMERPVISIRTQNPSKSEIHAWNSDPACETQESRISDKAWKLGVPMKCFYWSNITWIQFFKVDNTLPPHKQSDLEEFLSINNIVPLASISFILFDDQYFDLVYDETTNIVRIAYK